MFNISENHPHKCTGLTCMHPTFHFRNFVTVKDEKYKINIYQKLPCLTQLHLYNVGLITDKTEMD